MKRLIRNGVFETNSSSSHTVCVSRGAKVYDTIAPDIHGVVTIEPGEFGWEREVYYDPQTKASYAMAFAGDAKNSQELLAMLEKVIKDHTMCNTVVLKAEKDWQGLDSYGDIDHQSGPHEGGDCWKAFESEQALKDFLFGPDSYVETDNDNH